MTPEFDISQLTPTERLQLIDKLWDSLIADPETVPIPDQHLNELNRRLDALESGAMPAGEPWEIVRKRLWSE
jgi:putative addiction module component (TIGR02574 family)